MIYATTSPMDGSTLDLYLTTGNTVLLSKPIAMTMIEYQAIALTLIIATVDEEHLIDSMMTLKTDSTMKLAVDIVTDSLVTMIASMMINPRVLEVAAEGIKGEAGVDLVGDLVTTKEGVDSAIYTVVDLLEMTPVDDSVETALGVEDSTETIAVEDSMKSQVLPLMMVEGSENEEDDPSEEDVVEFRMVQIEEEEDQTFVVAVAEDEMIIAASVGEALTLEAHPTTAMSLSTVERTTNKSRLRCHQDRFMEVGVEASTISLPLLEGVGVMLMVDGTFPTMTAHIATIPLMIVERDHLKANRRLIITTTNVPGMTTAILDMIAVSIPASKKPISTRTYNRLLHSSSHKHSSNIIHNNQGNGLSELIFQIRGRDKTLESTRIPATRLTLETAKIRGTGQQRHLMFPNEIQIGQELLMLYVLEASLNPTITTAQANLASNQVLFLRLVTGLPIEMQRINRLKAIPPEVVVASLREVSDEAVVVSIEVVVFTCIIGKAPLMADEEGGTTPEFSKILAIEKKETPLTLRLHWTAQIHSEKTRTRRSDSQNQYNRWSTYNWQL
jgi:hypothetical protein